MSATYSRRRLLQTITGGSSLLLAGCGQGDSGTSTGTTGGSGSTQTFRAPIDQDPARTSFYAAWLSYGDLLESASAVPPRERAPGRLRRFIREPGVRTDKFYVGGDIQYTWLEEPIIITPTEVTVTIPVDARWSDGQPITGRDLTVYPLVQHLRKHVPPFSVTEEDRAPTHIWGAFDGIDVTDQSVTYRSSKGYFEQFWDWTIRTRFGIWGLQGDTVIPTHLTPYDGLPTP